MSVEKEPTGSFRENIEKEPELTSPQNENPLEAGAGTKLEESATITKQEPLVGHEERVPRTIKFETLASLVGRIVLIRDRVARAEGRLDDPLFKSATVERDASGNLRVVIDRGQYYPLYTGDRQTSFSIASQEDVDRLEISLPEKQI